ncbi:hypothetical protein GCM10027168_59990 [Streptomyces capparidis]
MPISYAARLAACAIPAGLLLLAAPAASAISGGVVVVSPGTVRPGQTVTVSVSGCVTADRDAKPQAYSNAFTGQTLNLRSSGGQGAVTGTGTIRGDTPAGRYRVEVSCDYKTQAPAISATIEVLGPGQGPGPGGGKGESSPGGPAPEPSTSHASALPDKGAHGGVGGGTVDRRTLALAGGSAMLLAAAGGGVIALRRRSAGSGGDVPAD